MRAVSWHTACAMASAMPLFPPRANVMEPWAGVLAKRGAGFQSIARRRIPPLHPLGNEVDGEYRVQNGVAGFLDLFQPQERGTRPRNWR